MMPNKSGAATACSLEENFAWKEQDFPTGGIILTTMAGITGTIISHTIIGKMVTTVTTIAIHYPIIYFPIGTGNK